MLWIIFKVFFSGNVRGRVEADMFCLFCFEESSKEKFSSNLSSSEHFSSRSFPGVTVLEKFLDLNVFYRSGRTFLSFWAEKHPGWTSKRLFWRCSLLQDNRWECFRWFLPLMFAKKKTETRRLWIVGATYSTERWGHKRDMWHSRYFVYVSYQHVRSRSEGLERRSCRPAGFRASRWISQLPLRPIWWKSLWTGSQLCCTRWHHGTFLCERGLSEGRGGENERAC